MCGVKEGVEKLNFDWTPDENFGIWGACMGVGGDVAEWSLVREQVSGLPSYQDPSN